MARGDQQEEEQGQEGGSGRGKGGGTCRRDDEDSGMMSGIKQRRRMNHDFLYQIFSDRVKKTRVRRW